MKDDKEKYEELVAKLKDWHDRLDDSSVTKQRLEAILPEFKETKEDKARKGLIALVDWAKHLVASGMTADDVKLYLDFLNNKHENPLKCTEEDEAMILSAINGLTPGIYDKEREFLANRLRNLCPQWWPDEDEMAELWDCADQNNIQGSILTRLYNKLNKGND